MIIDNYVDCEVGQTHTLWGLFDCHVDNRYSDVKLLKEDIQKIIDDPLARCVIGGDFNDMIFFGDPRFQSANLSKFLVDWHRGDDDNENANNLAKAVKEYNMSILQPLAEAGKIDAYLAGNHEINFEKRHIFNAAEDTADLLNGVQMAKHNKPVPYVGYECGMRYYFKRGISVKMIPGWVHHGWGGAPVVSGGAIQLYRAKGERHVQFGMFGHIHSKIFRTFAPLKIQGGFGKGKWMESPTVMAVCGTYLKNVPDHRNSTYAQMKGLSAAPLGAGRIYFDVKREDVGGLKVTPRIN